MALPTFSIVVIGAVATHTITYTTGTEITIAREDVTLLSEDYLIAYQDTNNLDSIDAVLDDLGITDSREGIAL